MLIILRKIATSKWEFRKLTHAFLILINASLILRLELSFTMSSSLHVGARTETWHCAYKNNISPTAHLLPATQRQSVGCKSLLIFPESMNLAHLGTLPVPRLNLMLWCGRFRDVIGLGVRHIPSKPLTHGISFDNGSLRCMMSCTTQMNWNVLLLKHAACNSSCESQACDILVDGVIYLLVVFCNILSPWGKMLVSERCGR